jgi:hypothetical protein
MTHPRPPVVPTVVRAAIVVTAAVVDGTTTIIAIVGGIVAVVIAAGGIIAAGTGVIVVTAAVGNPAAKGTKVIETDPAANHLKKSTPTDLTTMTGVKEIGGSTAERTNITVNGGRPPPNHSKATTPNNRENTKDQGKTVDTG